MQRDQRGGVQRAGAAGGDRLRPPLRPRAQDGREGRRGVLLLQVNNPLLLEGTTGRGRWWWCRGLLESASVEVADERVHAQVDVALGQARSGAAALRRLVLVEDAVETVKFGLLLWALTYVGAWFSGLTLLALALVAVFTLPKVPKPSSPSPQLTPVG